MPEELPVEEFLRSAKDLQLRDGGGEWDVLVYAVDHSERPSRVIWPYGPDNPYRKFRTDRGCRAKLIATFSYMRWTFFNFLAAEGTQERAERTT